MENRSPGFDELLSGYLNGSLSSKEKKNFYELLASGDFDDLVNQDMLDKLQKDISITETSIGDDRLDTIYKSKIRTEIVHTTNTVAHHKRGKIRRMLTWGAVAASVSLLTASIWFGYRLSPQALPVSGLREANIIAEKPTMVRLADKQFVRLPDGSSVLLNDGAELSYDPASFSPEIQTREVELKGEAYFDIKTDSNRVFIVRSGEISTTVLGTAFNIKSRQDRDEVQVTVSRGKVSVGSKSETYGLLTSDQQLTVNTKTNTFRKTELKSATVTEWKDNFLILDDDRMENVARELHQRFGIKIRFKKESLKNCYVTASFLNNEDLDHVLEVISSINGLEYSYENNGAEVVVDGEVQCE